MRFKLHSPYSPTGDQPQAIEKLTYGLEKGFTHQTLLGVTGSGKTFSMANVIQNIQKPTLVIAHNKTLAAQLATEFREFFPENAVHYFVSYYDYYQPEAYIPSTDTYIEKETSINDEIDRLRHAATRSILTRNDVIIVASVSCIYGIGEKEDYLAETQEIKVGKPLDRSEFLRKLVEQQYSRNDFELARGRFRVKGDTVEIIPSYSENSLRIDFYGSEIENIYEIDWITGAILNKLEGAEIFPAKHFVMPKDKMRPALKNIKAELEDQIKFLKKQGKEVEAQRISQRTRYDIEMIEEMGYVNGIENYSRHLSGRAKGSPPTTLVDYFPKDFLLIVDESHITLPQIRGMSAGDKARKATLVEHGFRLPSAFDNRPLTFEEFNSRINQVVYTSATPRDYEQTQSSQIVEQIIRPTGLLDPEIEVRKTEGQVDDLIKEIKAHTKKHQRVLVTTLTKRLAEDLSTFLAESDIKVTYLHSEIETLERLDILRDLRLGTYDVLVGINLLREGLDLPEVSLIVILDADKEGYLRTYDSLIQVIGRAARHVEGKAIMYADIESESMKRAISETLRRRKIQEDYNKKHGITPQSVTKEISADDWIPRKDKLAELEKEKIEKLRFSEIPADELVRIIKNLEKQMDLSARNLEFERAAELRDEIKELRKLQKK